MRKGIYVYKDQESMNKLLSFYDKAMQDLNIPYTEEYIETSYGTTHLVTAGDTTKPKIFTVHGGNGTTPVNLKLFKYLTKNFCLLTSDVIGMPGKSEPYRNLNSNNDDYGIWLREILDKKGIDKIPFVVSSYSSAMLLTLAHVAPERIEKAALAVPSGIAHGNIFHIAKKMTVPMLKYYKVQDEESFKGIIDLMATEEDQETEEFFRLMMSSYKMEMRPPREFKKKELKDYKAPTIIFASDEDIFFPACRVFPKAKEIFQDPKLIKISGNHLPSAKIMEEVCRKIEEFFVD